MSRKGWSKTQVLYKDKVKIVVLFKKIIKGVGPAQGYPKRFVNVNISKKYADAASRIIRFFTVKMAPGANNNMAG